MEKKHVHAHVHVHKQYIHVHVPSTRSRQWLEILSYIRTIGLSPMPAVQVHELHVHEHVLAAHIEKL